MLQLNADIASHAGYPPDDAFLEGYRKLFATRDATYEASMLRDLEKGGQVEVDQIVVGDRGIFRGHRLADPAGRYDAARLATVTYGKDRPVALGSDEASWAKNRRAVTVTID